MDSRNAQNAQAVYLATRVNTASREQLLLITYEIGVKACRNASSALASGSAEEANRNIQKAQDVLRELMVTLDVEAGGEVAEGLMKLYDFMYLLLVEANVRKEPEKISIVQGMLEELKGTWEEAVIKLAAEQQGHSAPVPGASSERQEVPAGGLNIAG
ncbi:flagellar export chaperone FliS [Aminivibrio sp.]|jgi:flagellar protein FliS|uniref:flagellar export chaperone FliS n=1 Tax=Aminivibrio sp. TaxID=1872489 RepID=UPI001A522C45|nr:flagellar export chaperone FliS [Aminivibrio sp.]MBL3538863.1 flagellar export chaperone FliS [Aminivibrio sp.]MDK2958307.1 flagellar secretion chaperone FliS [Synergistaceae bacterium]